MTTQATRTQAMDYAIKSGADDPVAAAEKIEAYLCGPVVTGPLLQRAGAVAADVQPVTPENVRSLAALIADMADALGRLQPADNAGGSGS